MSGKRILRLVIALVLSGNGAEMVRAEMGAEMGRSGNGAEMGSDSIK